MIGSVRNRSLSAWCTHATRPNVVGARKSKRNGRREGTGPNEKRVACFLTTSNMKIMGNGDGMHMPPPPPNNLLGIGSRASKSSLLPLPARIEDASPRACNPIRRGRRRSPPAFRSRPPSKLDRTDPATLNFGLRTSNCQFHHQGHDHPLARWIES